MKAEIKPRARADELVVRDMDSEVLVYDLDKDEAISLNPLAAAVWRSCDGTRSVAQIAEKLEDEFTGDQVPEGSVWRALDMLSRCDLLEERVAVPVDSSRRDLMMAMGKGAALVPFVTMIVVPTPAQAASCGCIAPGDCFIQAACPSMVNCNGAGVCAP
jgi:Coenzyme PQQ synthesis protein D (PqqD)